MRGTDLDHPFRGVNLAKAAAHDLESLCLALQTRLPPDAFVCGATAARLMKLPLPLELERGTTIHVAVPAPRTAPTGRGLTGHSVRVDSRDVQQRRGLRVSTPARVFCELSKAIDLPDLVAVGDYLISHQVPMVDLDTLVDTVERYPRGKGGATLRAAVPLLDGRSESRRESMLRVIVVTGGITGVVPNEWIDTSGGERYRGDLVVREKKVVIEYQSRFHEDPIDFRKDMTRISRLEADGWVVIQVNANDLADPAELLARIRLVLASR
jgi:hypothetical protein